MKWLLPDDEIAPAPAPDDGDYVDAWYTVVIAETLPLRLCCAFTFVNDWI